MVRMVVRWERVAQHGSGHVVASVEWRHYSEHTDCYNSLNMTWQYLIVSLSDQRKRPASLTILHTCSNHGRTSRHSGKIRTVGCADGRDKLLLLLFCACSVLLGGALGIDTDRRPCSGAPTQLVTVCDMSAVRDHQFTITSRHDAALLWT